MKVELVAVIALGLLATMALGSSNPDPSLKTACDDITYGYCRLDEGNVFMSPHLALFDKVNQTLCQMLCSIEEDCTYYVYENQVCSFVKDPEQYFRTCRDVASTPHMNFAGCYENNKAASCNKEELGPRKFGACVYDGVILERMPVSDVKICEKACNLRHNLKDTNEHCRYFIYNSELGECQLMGETERSCFRNMGPHLERTLCGQGDMADQFAELEDKVATESLPGSGSGADTLNMAVSAILITAVIQLLFH